MAEPLKFLLPDPPPEDPIWAECMKHLDDSIAHGIPYEYGEAWNWSMEDW